MELSLIPTKDVHEMLGGWWLGHGWPVLPIEALPDHALVVFYQNKPQVAGFLYDSDTVIAWLEFVVSDPEGDRTVRKDALDVLIQGAISLAQGYNKRMIFTSLNRPGLIDKYQKHGFQVADTGMTNLILRI